MRWLSCQKNLAHLKINKAETQTTWEGQLVSGGALAGGRKHEYQSKLVWAEASLEGDEKREGVVCTYKDLGSGLVFLPQQLGRELVVCCL